MASRALVLSFRWSAVNVLYGPGGSAIAASLAKSSTPSVSPRASSEIPASAALASSSSRDQP